MSQATALIKQVLILAIAQTLLIFQTPTTPKPTRTTLVVFNCTFTPSEIKTTSVVLVGLGAIVGKQEVNITAYD